MEGGEEDGVGIRIVRTQNREALGKGHGVEVRDALARDVQAAVFQENLERGERAAELDLPAARYDHVSVHDEDDGPHDRQHGIVEHNRVGTVDGGERGRCRRGVAQRAADVHDVRPEGPIVSRRGQVSRPGGLVLKKHRLVRLRAIEDAGRVNEGRRRRIGSNDLPIVRVGEPVAAARR